MFGLVKNDEMRWFFF